MTALILVAAGILLLPLLAVAVLGLVITMTGDRDYRRERVQRAEWFLAAHPEFRERLIADGMYEGEPS